MCKIECVWNMMAHAQKPDFVFHQNGQVHLNRRGHQFSQLLAAEVCASALVMLHTQHSEVVWEYWLPTQFASFAFTSPPTCHRVPSGFKNTLLTKYLQCTILSQIWLLFYLSAMTILCIWKPSFINKEQKCTNKILYRISWLLDSGSSFIKFV